MDLDSILSSEVEELLSTSVLEMDLVETDGIVGIDGTDGIDGTLLGTSVTLGIHSTTDISTMDSIIMVTVRMEMDLTTILGQPTIITM